MPQGFFFATTARKAGDVAMKVRPDKLPLSLRGLIGVFVLVQLGWITLLGFHTWQRQLEELEGDLQLNARFLGAASQAVLDSVGLGMVSLSSRLVSELQDPLQAPLAATKELRLLQRLQGRIDALMLLRPDGTVVAHSLFPDPAQVPPLPKGLPEQLSFTSQSGYVVGPTERGSTDSQWYLTLYQTHYYPNGRPHFLLGARLRIDAERPMWSNFELPAKHAMTIAHTDGTIVARWPAPNPEQIYSGTADMPVMRLLATSMEKSGEGMIYLPISVDGRERLAAFAHLEDFPLVAIASVDYSLQRDLWLSRNREWFVSGALFLGFSLGLFFYLTILERRHHGELEQASLTDVLTGLLNRRGFVARTGELLEQSEASGELSLFYLDLDHFKSVNDNYGHECGDELLRQCAQRIRAAIRDKDLAARLGGDEFVVVLPETDNQAATAILARLREQFIAPFIIGGNSLFMRPSIGMASSHAIVGCLDGLMSRADHAMYAEKCWRKQMAGSAGAPADGSVAQSGVAASVGSSTESS